MGSPAFRENAARVIFESTGYDRSGLGNFLTQVTADQKTPDSGATDTISMMKAKQVQAMPGSTLLENAPEKPGKGAGGPDVAPIVSA